VRTYKKWTKEEEDFLKENYQKLTVKEIAEALGRSYASCVGKIQALEMSGTNTDTISLANISIETFHHKKLEKYPEKVRARKLVHNAIKNGTLEKQPCEFCCTEEDVHAHHDDYSSPLNVRWLCGKHHRRLHRKLYGRA
jgi:IS30 family transposase